MAWTPQYIPTFLAVLSEVTGEKIGNFFFHFETMRAVDPELVKVIIAFAFMSSHICAAEYDTAKAIFCFISDSSKLTLIFPSASTFSIIFFIISTDSITYLPLAV